MTDRTRPERTNRGGAGAPPSARPYIPATRYKCLPCGGYAVFNGAAWEIDHRPGCGTPGAARAELVRRRAAEIHAARCHIEHWTPMAGCWGPSAEDRQAAEEQIPRAA